MKKLLVGIFLFTLCVLQAQTASQIIDKNIEITGGLTNWKLLNSILLQGKVILGVKEEYPVRIFQQRPNLTKTIITINNKESVVEGFDGKKGYSMNYATNKLQEVKNYVPESFDTDFIDYEAKGFEIKLLGREQVGTADCFKIELTKNVNKNLYYFDSKTYMLVKEVTPEETHLYSNFKKIGDLVMPTRIENTTPKREGDYVLMINKIELNKAFPANTFKF